MRPVRDHLEHLRLAAWWSWHTPFAPNEQPPDRQAKDDEAAGGMPDDRRRQRVGACIQSGIIGVSDPVMEQVLQRHEKDRDPVKADLKLAVPGGIGHG